MKIISRFLLTLPSLVCCITSLIAEPIEISGIYPHLTMWNDENECGTGAVVVWQDRLWAITYAPHQPGGSTDKLYDITPDLTQYIYPDSVGGTPANRMIHQESNQLLIGPYVIDANRRIRVIGPDQMFGRLTANARHLTDPANKVYYATMEEGLYEVDIRTMDVNCLIRDGNNGAPKVGLVSQLPGYHGKGMYTGPGKLIYANNGERHPDVRTDPTIASGSLAEWNGSGDWQMIRRNQFTEVTGPGGIYGNSNPLSDPVWALGWDARSLLLGLLEDGSWTFYRLPKGSHSYDGSHGWNTEWPRIRDIGEKDWLATMHGTLWRFPETFSRSNSAGIAPRSNYLKVVGDFTRWRDRIVLGCDDSARAEFYNTRDFKAKNGAPRQSNSNLWFVKSERLDQLGPAIGRGSVWLRDAVDAGQVSDPYLFDGYDYRQLHLTHQSEYEVTFQLEVDREGKDCWEKLKEIQVRPGQSISHLFGPEETGSWIRLRAVQTATGVTANFQYRNQDTRNAKNDSMFSGIAVEANSPKSYGLMRSLSYNRLGIATSSSKTGDPIQYYEMNQQMELVPAKTSDAADQLVQDVSQPDKAFEVDAASVLIVEDGKRYRLPKNDDYLNESESSDYTRARVCREVATERDLLNIHGTFYELPARNAQGLAKVRPVATHNLKLHDFCSHNGLFLMTGLDFQTESDHIFTSADGKARVWAGVVDDLWKLGKPRGKGGPWFESKVQAGIPSDPYLMTAYDKKSVTMRSSTDTEIRLEVDVDGTGLWIEYNTFQVRSGQTTIHQFPEGFSAYWIRAISAKETTATVQFEYH